MVAAALAAMVVAIAATSRPAQADVKLDDALEKYTAVAGVSGNISSVGSDTCNNLMTLWAEGFRKHYPNVNFAVEGKGSSTAPPALIDGTSDIGPMSRKMKDKEIDAFEEKFGYKPSYIVIAIDALAVFAHKDNPIEKLSMPQVDAIFSENRKGGHPEDITKWGQVGLKGDWQNLGITLYGRNSVSGTYGYFKEHALYKGDYKKTVKEQPGSAAVVQSISEDRSAIGYSGIGYKTAGVKAVPLSKETDGEAFEATAENCYSGKYPLARFLNIYFNRAPGKNVSPVIREFFKFIHSREGQEVVNKDGFVPLNQGTIDKYADSYEDK
ncbi:MAG: phosphate ABC transporter substrate-binding protein [Planctomycetes bacterium]|nr:phosphate ABC transporter substrate-binding protein [Planctomycetota bacterium]